MSDPSLIARDLGAFVDARVRRALAEAFGGSPGVYHNASITVTRTGALQFASGGGEVAFDWSGGTAGDGTITYVAPYAMTFADMVQAGDSGTVTILAQTGGTGAFTATALPVFLDRGQAVRLACTGLSGTAGYRAATLIRDFAGTVVPT